jgi:hypothetical protein
VQDALPEEQLPQLRSLKTAYSVWSRVHVGVSVGLTGNALPRAQTVREVLQRIATAQAGAVT